MRILIVSDHYPPATGGAERQTRLLAHAFHDRGDDVAVAVPWYLGAERVEDDDGVTVHRVHQMRTLMPRLVRTTTQRHAPPFPDPVTARDIRRLVRRFRPDVVHSHGWITYSVALATLGTDIPLIATARDYGYFCPNRTLVRDGAPCSGPSPAKCIACAGRYYGVPKGWLATVGVYLWRPLLRRRVTALHSISSFVADAMRTHFLPELAAGSRNGTGPVEYVIPSFRDEADALAPADLEPYLAPLPDEPFILFVGQFRYVKGVDVLLEAYTRLRHAPPLVFIGTFGWDGPDELPPNVTALTAIPHSAVMAAWERALFGVMPSLWPEPFGSVVHEGMSRGKPIIGTAHGGHTDMIIDGETGYLVLPGDIHGLQQAMQTLIDDAAQRERLGGAARERAELFASHTVIPRFVDAFESVSRRGTSRAEVSP